MARHLALVTRESLQLEIEAEADTDSAKLWLNEHYGRGSQEDLAPKPATAHVSQYDRTMLDAEIEHDIREAYKGGIWPAPEPGTPIDINSAYPAGWASEAPSSVDCPIHGPNCEAWAWN